jgi:NAD(P)-dependent dehydrogenase (short-subunit alcohol dehydrogenase family)
MNSKQAIMVTGASSGFGYLTALTLMSNGYTVIAAMREADRKNADKARALKAASENAPGSLLIVSMDVSEDASVSAAVDVALAWQDNIDVLVNNAGSGLSGFLETVTTTQLKRLFEVNLFGVHRATRAVLPSMRAAGKGLIINVSSIMGRIVLPFSGAYTSSKFALEALSESWRYELAGTGVETVIVEPGGYPTAFRENMSRGSDSERIKGYGPVADLPEKMSAAYAERMASSQAPDPQRVADAILNLIETPHGTRPFRTVVDDLMNGGGALEINAVTRDRQRQLLEGLSMAHLADVK